VLATLLTAYALGRKITIIGGGGCDVAGDTESVAYFAIEN
jgi:hypothetical protein